MAPLLELITHIGWIAVLAVIFAESGLMVGFFLPGDSLLFTAGFLVQEGLFHINIHLFFILLFCAAVLGNSTGYFFGHRVGRRLFQRKDSRLFHKDNLDMAERFYEKYGSRAIVLAMFVPIARTFTPIVAGISEMSYQKFVTYNIIGAALWTATFTYLGYYAGGYVRHLGLNIELVALIIVFLSIAPALIHILRDKSRRRSVGTQLRNIVKRKR
jgi:membrane-associated protein